MESNIETWRGTAPFCSGQCLSDERQIMSTTCCCDENPDCGSCCWSGTKVLCEQDLLCLNTITIKTCYPGSLLICDSGYYKNGIWVSCKKYYCGGCSYGGI